MEQLRYLLSYCWRGEKTIAWTMFPCDRCEKSYTARGALITHKRQHHSGEKPHRCDQCGRCYVWESQLKTHYRVHTGEKPYDCDLCNKKFSTSSKLTIHLRAHTGDKPHTCKICGMSFVVSGSLNCHMRIHTGEKRFTCDTCGRAFARLCMLKRTNSPTPRRKPSAVTFVGKSSEPGMMSMFTSWYTQMKDPSSATSAIRGLRLCLN
uniref:C2H2-type domain-containing protein n=1 Tax=Neogobius melanostomus TaxID=47308 RepID=A0A8C6S7E3_9GOBI